MYRIRLQGLTRCSSEAWPNVPRRNRVYNTNGSPTPRLIEYCLVVQNHSDDSFAKFPAADRS